MAQFPSLQACSKRSCLIISGSKFIFPSYYLPFRTDVTDCLASVYHKVNDTTEVGLNTTYNLQTSNVGVGVVGKYVLDSDSHVKVRK